jgi:hypothetical protein
VIEGNYSAHKPDHGVIEHLYVVIERVYSVIEGNYFVIDRV